MKDQWLDWAKQLQSIAQAGLTYSKDVYDLERFEQLRTLSVEIMTKHTDVEMTKITDLFANETGYATPKVDIRAVVFKDEKILLVKETIDGKWSLPGGWADIGYTPGEVAVKETKEEAGFDVKATKLLAVLDKKCHPHPPSPYHVYKIFIRCEIIGGEPMKGTETSDVAFFAETELPPLSVGRNTTSQIKLAFEYLRNPDKPACFDEVAR
ncbi:ADP-ribose pyrophosphatase YjhB, NUDIX family [Evansella caseinilytica]|uniref:ADP-ribose pyrophosphatase YjhB, NUDIX family n=1 Tax=Evansella caseinilytica TaxID=1503961 RepID=A0A1H3HXM2_9BACI|nr:NUDIX hydrolase [Evansella caseinilytica]SDY19519.1 ADP-ribose pyrophosphatase YjhB, NUDIX family [Evansella caseinilytica]